MRVTGGEAGGVRLRALRGSDTRPTTDQARKAIFDILGPQVEGARVVDLFAGTGALGIEALSRGAAEAVFVESSREACSIILANLEAAGVRARGVVRRTDVERFLGRRPDDPFDLAFLDPPYARGLGFVARILGKLAPGSPSNQPENEARSRPDGRRGNSQTGDWIRAGGTVVVESVVGEVPWPDGFHQTRVRPFGRTQIAVAVRDDDA
jgi:16S rRNA (guanine(966)-N(2))-methyltransferase RsmD